MRLIDADALFQEMIKTIANMMRTRRWMRKDEANEEEILSVIQNAPTIDYAPVRHGEWDCDDVYVWRCTLCKKWLMVEDQDGEMNFCPNCGASMMDGGKSDA